MSPGSWLSDVDRERARCFQLARSAARVARTANPVAAAFALDTSTGRSQTLDEQVLLFGYARSVCAACPVLDACRRAAVAPGRPLAEVQSFMGGLTPVEQVAAIRGGLSGGEPGLGQG